MHDYRLLADPWSFLPEEITAPVQFWHGDADPIVPLHHAHDLVARILRARLHVVPRRGAPAGAVGRRVDHRRAGGLGGRSGQAAGTRVTGAGSVEGAWRDQGSARFTILRTTLPNCLPSGPVL